METPDTCPRCGEGQAPEVVRCPDCEQDLFVFRTFDELKALPKGVLFEDARGTRWMKVRVSALGNHRGEFEQAVSLTSSRGTQPGDVMHLSWVELPAFRVVLL